MLARTFKDVDEEKHLDVHLEEVYEDEMEDVRREEHHAEVLVPSDAHS